MNVAELLRKRAEMKPESGYSVIVVESFGDPDEQGAYEVANYPSEDEAEAHAQDLNSKGTDAYVVPA